MLNALTQFIPVQQGQSAYIKEQKLINNLMGLVGYEISGDGYVIFTEDITASCPAVDMQLVVMDFDHYSDFDLLPMTADMAAEVVQAVSLMLLQAPQTDLKVDSITETVPQKR